MYCYITDASIALFGFNFNTPLAAIANGVLSFLSMHAAGIKTVVLFLAECQKQTVVLLVYNFHNTVILESQNIQGGSMSIFINESHLACRAACCISLDFGLT